MGLEEVAQDVADDLQLPVVIFDTEMHVVAFSTHESTVDAARKEIILSRRGSAKSVEMIAEYHVGSARHPVRLPARDEVPSRILVPLRHNELLVGYLSCLNADDQLDLLPAQVELLEKAAVTLSDLVALRTLEERETRERSSDLLQRLVSESAETRLTGAKEAVDQGFLARADGYSIVILDDLAPSDPRGAKAKLAVTEAASILARSVGGAIAGAMPHAGSLVVLPRPLDRGRLELILGRPEFTALRAGEGSRRALADLARSHHEASIALRFARLDPRQTSRFATWSELGLDALLIQLPLEAFIIQDLPSALQILLAAPNAGILIPTLETYLRSGGDALETARRLPIHRSTLYYRLDKIRSLTAVDLADGATRRELHTALRIAELAGLWSAPSSAGPQLRV